jgi:hypothetical protein
MFQDSHDSYVSYFGFNPKKFAAIEPLFYHFLAVIVIVRRTILNDALMLFISFHSRIVFYFNGTTDLPNYLFEMK